MGRTGALAIPVLSVGLIGTGQICVLADKAMVRAGPKAARPTRA
jgi:hypothetical protein